MGRKREQASRKLNNSGMTLVEVLVAMLMLSMVSLVFLRAFSQTMFYNKNAREKQYALTVAQSMMEGTKAYGMDALDEQFSGAAPFRLYPPAISSAKSGSCATGRYRVEGVKTGDFTFDVEIEVTPAVADASRPNMVTEASLANGSDINKYKDAIYVQGGREQDVVYEKVVNALKAVPDMHYEEKIRLTKDTVKWSYVTLEIKNRTLRVEIGPSTVTVKNIYEYQFDITDYPYRTTSDPEGSESGICGTSGNGFATGDEVECYNNTNTVGPAGATGRPLRLENVYLYYYPAYKSTRGGYIKCDNDVIEINNFSYGIVNVYAVKQMNEALNSTETKLCEDTYKVKVYQTGTKGINLYHNLNQRLAGTGDGSYTWNPSIAEECVDKQTLWEKDTAPRALIYDVKVVVREHVVADPFTGRIVYELSGTVNEK